MRIIPDARRVVILSYSFWAQILGLLALILPEALFAVAGIEIDPYLLWRIGFGLLLFGIIGRIVVQTGGAVANLARIAAVVALILAASVALASASPRPATEAETLAIAVPFIGQAEGKRNAAYLDIVGVPTICYGSTRGVKLGQRMTDAECTALLRAEVAEYRHGLHRYFSADTIRTRLPPPRDAAFTSLAFNVGIAGAGRSTAVRRLNAGDVPGACEAITWWNKAGHRVVRGLVIRRAGERGLCLRVA